MSTQSIPSTELSPDEITRLNAVAEEVDIDSIIIGDRVRRDFSHVRDLAESIKQHGLIQPVVITHDRRLIAGESRIRAHRELGRKTIRAVFRGCLDEAQLDILECEENNTRKGFTWQERCLSVARTHRYKSTEAALRGKRWGIRESAELLKQSTGNISLITFVADHLHQNNEAVWKAENIQDAYRVILRQREEEALKLVAASSVPTTPKSTPPATPAALPKTPGLEIPQVDFFGKPVDFFTPGVSGPEVTDELPGQEKPTEHLVVPISQMILRETGGENSLNVLTSLGADAFDHIICDPPYAEDMGNLSQSNGGMSGIDGVAQEHDVVKNLILLQDFIKQAFVSVRDRGFLVMFCDPFQWRFLLDCADSVGWRVQRWPLVWHKTSACMNQSASTNWTKNIEFALVARKGTATLISQQPSSVYTGGNDLETKLLGHPFAKPAGLWEWVYRAVCQKGARVCDPFLGSGSSMLPAIRLGLHPIGIECNEIHYARALVNVQNFYKTLDPQCTFS